MLNTTTGVLHSVDSRVRAAEAEQHKYPIFRVGEEVELKGGKFRIQGFGAKILRLEAQPGTSVVDEFPRQIPRATLTTLAHLGYVQASTLPDQNELAVLVEAGIAQRAHGFVILTSFGVAVCLKLDLLKVSV